MSGTPNPGKVPGASRAPSTDESPQPTGTASGQKDGERNAVGDNADSIGFIHTAGTLSYCIVKRVDDGEGEVIVSASKHKKITSVVIPKKIKIGKKTYKVTGIAKNAFKNCKSLKKITIKTKTLKKVGKNAIKGIYKKAKIICPKNKKVYIKKYKKLFKKNTGYRKTMKIK